MTGFDPAARVIDAAIEARVFPAAAAEVGASGGVLWRDAFGHLTFDAESARTAIETPFDLASLTKVMATTAVVAQLLNDGRLRLDEPVSASFDEWRGADRESVTVRDLLEHASGLPARLVDAPPAGRREFEHDICATRLETAPRSRAIYSDLGFILLGFLAEDRGGASLAKQFDAVMVRLKPDTADETIGADLRESSVRPHPDLAFDLPPDRRRAAAPTMPMDDDPRRGRMLVGEVHDNYAAALGGVAGHAGLFGSAAAVGRFAVAVLRAARGHDEPAPFSPALVATMTTKSAVPGSSRALGWDTMLPTSSCGTRMSAAAFGHVGFTGTSLWVDPVRDRYYVLLANRACGGGSVDAMRDVRRAFHDALSWS
jgi:CubicO group peptidase (beta-lactamase class C family)